MKYGDIGAEIAYLLAANGRAVIEVGSRSEVKPGSMWQALVRVNRANLVLAGLSDDRRIYGSIRPGYDTLIWVIEDQPGHIIAHRKTDCDSAGYVERIKQVGESFSQVTAWYTAPSEDVDFDYDESSVLTP